MSAPIIRIPSLKLTASLPLKIGLLAPKGNEKVFQLPFFRCFNSLANRFRESTVSGWSGDQSAVPQLRMLPGVNGTGCSAYPACVAVGMTGQCCPNSAKVSIFFWEGKHGHLIYHLPFEKVWTHHSIETTN